MDSAKLEFLKSFPGEPITQCRMDFISGEPVVVIQSAHRRAHYSQRIELIKIINLQGEM